MIRRVFHGWFKTSRPTWNCRNSPDNSVFHHASAESFASNFACVWPDYFLTSAHIRPHLERRQSFATPHSRLPDFVFKEHLHVTGKIPHLTINPCFTGHSTSGQPAGFHRHSGFGSNHHAPATIIAGGNHQVKN